MTYNHLMASLRQKITLGGGDVILVGVAPTITSPDKKKRPMGFTIEEGTLHLGYQVGQRLGVKSGDMLKLADRDFKIAKVMVEYGTEEDVYVYGTLKDVQEIAGKPGQINEIKAIDCLCLTADQDPIASCVGSWKKYCPKPKLFKTAFKQTPERVNAKWCRKSSNF
jgi:hypothetical protein